MQLLISAPERAARHHSTFLGIWHVFYSFFPSVRLRVTYHSVSNHLEYSSRTNVCEYSSYNIMETQSVRSGHTIILGPPESGFDVYRKPFFDSSRNFTSLLF